jgi:hypothetical protein
VPKAATARLEWLMAKRPDERDAAFLSHLVVVLG